MMLVLNVRGVGLQKGCLKKYRFLKDFYKILA